MDFLYFSRSSWGLEYLITVISIREITEEFLSLLNDAGVHVAEVKFLSTTASAQLLVCDVVANGRAILGQRLLEDIDVFLCLARMPLDSEALFQTDCVSGESGGVSPVSDQVGVMQPNMSVWCLTNLPLHNW